jgi:hypothetical protein
MHTCAVLGYEQAPSVVAGPAPVGALEACLADIQKSGKTDPIKVHIYMYIYVCVCVYVWVCIYVHRSHTICIVVKQILSRYMCVCVCVYVHRSHTICMCAPERFGSMCLHA